MTADTLQLDQELMTALQSDSQYDYDREINSGGESLLEWLRRVINKWVFDHLDIVLSDDVTNYILIGIGVLVVLFLVFLYWQLRPKLFIRNEKGDDLTYEVQEDTIYGIDFKGDIYGRMITVSFIRYLRPEMKFRNADNLVMQLDQDLRDTNRILDAYEQSVS